MAEDTIIDIPVNAVGESYGRFRIIDPAAEVFMRDSIHRFGQILPAVVVRGPESRGYEIIDGFKRLRACRELGLKTIQAKVLSLGERPVKAAILQLNWKARSIREMEEAMILHSLHREDNLSQVEIALLLGRHKSWVCRRISLVEQLCEEALSNIKLGLIGVGHGRQLTRLPRGNQEPVLAAILKYRLCCRETERLVTTLIEQPRGRGAPLGLVMEILDDRSAPLRSVKAGTDEPTLAQQLRKLSENCHTLLLVLDASEFDPISPQEQQVLVTAAESVGRLLARMRDLANPNI